MRIDGISALVTGGASGLGLATARRLLDLIGALRRHWRASDQITVPGATVDMNAAVPG